MNQRYNFINPKVGLTHQLGDYSNLYISYSVGNKEPSRTDFIDTPGGGTPNHETLGDLEIGYKHRSRSLMFNGNFYYMSYKNQLVLTGELNDVGSPLRKNVASSYRTGVEFDVSYRYSDKWRVMGNLTLS
jgi:iron complex outermembrane receptor protein